MDREQEGGGGRRRGKAERVHEQADRDDGAERGEPGREAQRTLVERVALGARRARARPRGSKPRRDAVGDVVRRRAVVPERVEPGSRPEAQLLAGLGAGSSCPTIVCRTLHASSHQRLPCTSGQRSAPARTPPPQRSSSHTRRVRARAARRAAARLLAPSGARSRAAARRAAAFAAAADPEGRRARCGCGSARAAAPALGSSGSCHGANGTDDARAASDEERRAERPPEAAAHRQERAPAVSRRPPHARLASRSPGSVAVERAPGVAADVDHHVRIDRRRAVATGSNWRVVAEPHEELGKALLVHAAVGVEDVERPALAARARAQSASSCSRCSTSTIPGS